MADSPKLERTRFHTGQLLTADDFTREQEYFRDKQKLHNRSLHGFGLVSGLGVTISGGQVNVEPGLALDCAGNEIVVDTRHTLPLLAAASGVAYVDIRYTETECNPTPVEATSETSLLQATTIKESFEVCFGRENRTRSHRHLRARWIACGEAHPLTIAKLRHSSQGWRVDRRYRAPVIK